MITNGDIDFMADSLDDIYINRTHPIILTYESVQFDDLTGLVIGKQDVPINTRAVVTELSSGDDRYMAGGIEYERGDVKIDVKLEGLNGAELLIDRATFDDVDYRIISDDKKGIGRRNRIEYIGRVIS